MYTFSVLYFFLKNIISYCLTFHNEIHAHVFGCYYHSTLVPQDIGYGNYKGL